MKKYSGWVFVIAGFMFAFTANAFAASGSLKIGYFDSLVAASQSQWGKKIADDLRREQQRIEKELEDKGRPWKTATEEYDKKREVMDEKTRVRKAKELADMYAELQKATAEANQSFNKRANEARQPLYQKIAEIATKMGKDEKYDYILEKQSLLFAHEKDDLTKKVIAELDKSSK